MDRFNASTTSADLDLRRANQKPEITMSALRRKLVELRREAKRHEHKALSDCLALAISLTSNKHAN